jgi:hypothetical protein
VSANVRQLAAAKGWDGFLLRGWDYGVALLPRAIGGAWHKSRWWFWLTMGLSGGIAASLWLVTAFPPQLGDKSGLPQVYSTFLEAYYELRGRLGAPQQDAFTAGNSDYEVFERLST